jgi:spermidine/putrescine transport system permease protein
MIKRLRAESLTIYAALAFAYLMLPIAVVIAFSFNNPKGRFNFTWQGFTLDNWLHPFGFPGLGPAVRLSLEIAVLSSFVATAIGTMMALALVRYGFRGRGVINTLIFLPMTTPEIVMGASLLTLFLNRGVATGFTTILIAHIMFNISYVVVTVKARLVGFDRHLEEAAMDLGATPWTTFRKVTLPLIAPGIAAAALLAAAISIDDYVITSFNAGQTTTFPLFIFGATRQGVPPEVNVLGSMLLVAVLILMGLNVLVQRRLSRRDARMRAGAPEPAVAEAA